MLHNVRANYWVNQRCWATPVWIKMRGNLSPPWWVGMHKTSFCIQVRFWVSRGKPIAPPPNFWSHSFNKRHLSYLNLKIKINQQHVVWNVFWTRSSSSSKTSSFLATLESHPRMHHWPLLTAKGLWAKCARYSWANVPQKRLAKVEQMTIT